jgi:hypothetical protein
MRLRSPASASSRTMLSYGGGGAREEKEDEEFEEFENEE